MARSFDDLVGEASSVSVDGWDFSWLAGRATEQRPSWGYARTMGERMAQAAAALDIQTGGGEVLASVPAFPRLTVLDERIRAEGLFIAHSTRFLIEARKPG